MCGASVSIWKRDLVSGLCPKCLAAQQQEVEQQRQEDERQRQAKEQADTARAKRDTATRHGIPQVYPDGCPNCGGELIPVLLFAREEFTFRQGMGVDAAVAYYATLEAEQGMFTGRFRIAGSIRASKCDKCHRVHFHGVPER
jgi:hypothetical protein